VKYFLSGSSPAATRILLVESGSRRVLERAIAGVERGFPGVTLELCTCYPGVPAAATAFQKVWRVTDAPSYGPKWRMAREIAATRPPIAALLFSGEPVMFTWKMLLLVLLPSKILLVNENGDFFWLDRSNLSTLRQFLGARLGMNGEGLLRGLCRVVMFPLVFLFLLLFAGIGYVVRWSRLLYWKLTGS
jgi:hypothetical protein